MKSIVPELSRSDAQELVERQAKEYRLIGSEKRIPGLILFEYDMTTGELRRADVDTSCILQMNGGLIAQRKVNKRELCLYIQALNEKNAMRKVREMLRRQSVRKKLFKQEKDGE